MAHSWYMKQGIHVALATWYPHSNYHMVSTWQFPHDIHIAISTWYLHSHYHMVSTWKLPHGNHMVSTWSPHGNHTPIMAIQAQRKDFRSGEAERSKLIVVKDLGVL